MLLWRNGIITITVIILIILLHEASYKMFHECSMFSWVDKVVLNVVQENQSFEFVM